MAETQSLVRSGAGAGIAQARAGCAETLGGSPILGPSPVADLLEITSPDERVDNGLDVGHGATDDRGDLLHVQGLLRPSSFILDAADKTLILKHCCAERVVEEQLSLACEIGCANKIAQRLEAITREERRLKAAAKELLVFIDVDKCDRANIIALTGDAISEDDVRIEAREIEEGELTVIERGRNPLCGINARGGVMGENGLQIEGLRHPPNAGFVFAGWHEVRC